MRYRLHHATNGLIIHALDDLIEPRKSQPLDHQLVLGGRGDLGAVVLNANLLDCGHHRSSTCLPRAVATSARSRNCASASNVALITLCGFGEPRLLVSTFCTPTEVMTARTAPPAITPVPSGAGFSSTCPEPNRPSTWCGIEVAVR